MDIKSLAAEMDGIVTQGAIVDAVKQFFAEDATTSDYSGVATTNKQQMVEKMEGFAGAIAKVNGITHHHTIVDGNVSASEFTFDFNMKDDSKIYWHEIIRRIWNTDGKVVQEEYFNAQ
ncbi:hypothetical protein DKG77_03900 [Flagellimonas aquimarina]|jgi:hypothetical protein|uniref:Nuclear transport factor 2 family protein n=1 Tax=Flagellimonas aquimarina TaxID=2201895 RepID=A0A316L298_9FLAO|nr:hypothetical protein [Allomuricauda koreensis]PWL39981.1 hypothetical protein DKG77_03900 [Allomuricauda koreensis]